MRMRNVPNKEEILNSSKYVVNNPMNYKGSWQKKFGNNNPIYLEIGVGRCDFIINNAKENPNINYIGLEKNASVLTYGLKKIDEHLENLILLNVDALDLDKVFDKEISRLFLNFSDPWPKTRHHKRRLTSDVYLNLYNSILKNDAIIVQKTDNSDLFEYSVLNFSKFDYKIIDISVDLANKKDYHNIMTEYETKFSNEGNKIYMITVCK